MNLLIISLLSLIIIVSSKVEDLPTVDGDTDVVDVDALLAQIKTPGVVHWQKENKDKKIEVSFLYFLKVS